MIVIVVRRHVNLFESIQIEPNATLSVDVARRFPEHEERREQMRVAVRNRRIGNVRRAAESVVRTHGRVRRRRRERMKRRRMPRGVDLKEESSPSTKAFRRIFVT